MHEGGEGRADGAGRGRQQPLVTRQGPHKASRCIIRPPAPPPHIHTPTTHPHTTHHTAPTQVPLEVENDVKAARIVKGRLERTTLGQVASGIAITLRPREPPWAAGKGGGASRRGR